MTDLIRTAVRGALLALTLAAGLGGTALRADDRPPAYLDPAMTDEDFPFQGEYQGWQRSQDSLRSSEGVGLQVYALGNGQFAGTKYYGGLPGQGWYGGERFQLTGERSGDVVRLNGGQYAVEVADGMARLYADDGRLAGELRRVDRVSPTMGAVAPEGAIILFDGTNVDHFKNAKMTPEGLLLPGTETVSAFGDFRMHAEFYLAYKPLGRGQDRGNSGFYIQSRYEVQVLDSFGLEGVENECGALYKTKRPDVNMCLPPLQWQTYDIDFTAPKFAADGTKVRDMVISVWHNGYPIHLQADIPNKTGGGSVEGPVPLPTKLQDHSNPVLFRNIWLIDKQNAEAMQQPWLELPLKAPPVPFRSYSAPIAITVIGGVQGVHFGCP